MRLQILLGIETEFYQLEDFSEALENARASGGTVYMWKTTGRSNWLEKRLSCVDALGLVVLPTGLPDFMEMPDDGIDENDALV